MYSLISFDVAPVLNFRTTNLSQADNSPSATLSRIVLHRGGGLTPPHRRFLTAVIAHGGQIDSRSRRIDSHDIVTQVPPAELSMMNASSGKGLAGQNSHYNRRNQGSDHDSSLAHSKLPPIDDVPRLLARPHRTLRPAIVTHGRTIAGPRRRTGHRRSAVADASGNRNAERGNGQRDSG
jgi:hypothetical protein